MNEYRTLKFTSPRDVFQHYDDDLQRRNLSKGLKDICLTLDDYMPMSRPSVNVRWSVEDRRMTRVRLLALTRLISNARYGMKLVLKHITESKADVLLVDALERLGRTKPSVRRDPLTQRRYVQTVRSYSHYDLALNCMNLLDRQVEADAKLHTPGQESDEVSALRALLSLYQAATETPARLSDLPSDRTAFTVTTSIYLGNNDGDATVGLVQTELSTDSLFASLANDPVWWVPRVGGSAGQGFAYTAPLYIRMSDYVRLIPPQVSTIGNWHSYCYSKVLVNGENRSIPIRMKFIGTALTAIGWPKESSLYSEDGYWTKSPLATTSGGTAEYAGMLAISDNGYSTRFFDPINPAEYVLYSDWMSAFESVVAKDSFES